jgi:hypothetical protein
MRRLRFGCGKRARQKPRGGGGAVTHAAAPKKDFSAENYVNLGTTGRGKGSINLAFRGPGAGFEVWPLRIVVTTTIVSRCSLVKKTSFFQVLRLHQPGIYSIKIAEAKGVTPAKSSAVSSGELPVSFLPHDGTCERAG